MLADINIDYIRARAWVFEHDWRFYSIFLGEPFLLDDFLVYYDGRMVFVCAFALSDRNRVLSSHDLNRLLDARSFEAAEAVDVWGQYERVEAVRVRGRHLPLIDHQRYDPSNVDMAIDLTGFEYSRFPGARKSLALAQRKGHRHLIGRRTTLTAQHLAVVEEWVAERGPSRLARHVNEASLVALIRTEGVSVVETYISEILMGFSVVSFPSPEMSMVVMTFIRRRPGVRAGDDLRAGAIECATNAGSRALHVGYSFTPGLADFKRKWAAEPAGVAWSESFFGEGPVAEHVESGSFIWIDRVLNTHPASEESDGITRPDLGAGE